MKKKIFYYVQSYWGKAWYRCHVPGVELKKRGYEVVLDDKLPRVVVKEFDVLVFQESADPGILQAIYDANSLGKLTVYEIDDYLWQISEENPSFSFWTRESLKWAEACIKASKLVTTTTPYLAKRLRHLNSNIIILPNMLPDEFWQFSCKKKKGEQLVIGWAGGHSHWNDLCLLRGVVEQILDEYPEVEFQVAGMREYPFQPHDRIKLLKATTVEKYPQILRNFDIGLAPLVDSEFNRCKSDLKYLEYTMAGAAFIGSKVEPYLQSVANGENGFLAKGAKDWLRYLRRLIENEHLRKKIVRKARQNAEQRLISKNISLWEKAYNITK
jgi:glycosyltransferase involved in cell wall biosynthesis